mgnify:CR=1 FL=1
MWEKIISAATFVGKRFFLGFWQLNKNIEAVLQQIKELQDDMVRYREEREKREALERVIRCPDCPLRETKES